MSEFYFDYRCECNASKDNKRKDLKFVLFQKYDKTNAPMCVQVVIPKDIQADLKEVRLYYDENGIGIPDHTKDPDEVFPCKYVMNYNAIFIIPKNHLAGTGKIVFVRNSKDEIDEISDVYKFAINFSQKQQIFYEIIEKRKKTILIKIVYPKLLDDIKLYVSKAKGHKPIFERECKNPKNYVKDSEGEVVEILLKARGSVGQNCISRRLTVEDATSLDYRLVFADPNNSLSFTLVDESNYTLEDKKRKRKESKRKIDIICPFCGHSLKSFRHKIGYHFCDGIKISKSKNCSFAAKKSKFFCNSAPQNVDSINPIPLPAGIHKKPSMHALFVGEVGSGKTIYLASLFNLKQQGRDVPQGHDEDGRKIAEPMVLDSIVKCFDRSKKTSVEEIFPPEESPSFLDSYINNRRRYVISVNGKIESQTVSNKNRDSEITRYPIALKMGKLGYSYFYDIPGEAFSEGKKLEANGLKMANCIIAIIDGESINKKGKNPLGELTACLNKVVSSYEEDQREQLFKMPIAVVYTKLDLYLKEHRDSKSACAEYTFDQNCHITRENIYNILPKNGVYKNSILERHIDNSSYEIEHFIKSFKDSTDMFEKTISQFENIKFFAVSSLGSPDVLLNSGGAKSTVQYEPRRVRTELPIIWLMYQKGLIRR